VPAYYVDIYLTFDFFDMKISLPVTCVLQNAHINFGFYAFLVLEFRVLKDRRTNRRERPKMRPYKSTRYRTVGEDKQVRSSTVSYINHVQIA